MKGIILAGGTGSRLMPLTKVTNKCLLPVGELPIINHCLNVLTLAGINDIMLVTGPDHMGHVIAMLGSGAEYGCSLTYKVQDEANGIAAALKLCKDFVGSDKFAVILGDNIFEDQALIASHVREFFLKEDNFKLFTKKVPDPERFGVPVFDGDKIVDIVEKPKAPPNNHAIVGLYCYSHQVFDVISGLSPSPRGEYEISDVNSHLVKNRNGSFAEVTCDWVDAGTHDSYKKANQMMWGVK